ncbi:nuclear transport factor 2 family protein [Cylindrospermum sp. FACHB-282]|uniref:nuclear transport factor 2 family protein n=1 Tax=Cylindrospermum sp. FACHB-282 TaxID=2692794 RepID=UPI0016899E77|nr:nuclear transport factor 2 family protein [Cylindrospermum sp. FACHB-282]MBD2386900.1 nuclear transport factor 2 family protein [Cylindrospermum sp. FACHB-282]
MTHMIGLLLKHHNRHPSTISRSLFLLTFGFISSWQSAQAITPQQFPLSGSIPARVTPHTRLPQQLSAAENPPPELKNLLTQVDAAASRADVKGLIQFYGSNFTHGDGLNRQTLETALTSLWQRYPKLRYTTQLQSWKSEGNSMIAETVTKITGSPSANSNNLALNATITSRQRITGGKIVNQEILSERTLVTSGSKPPQVNFIVPQQVKVGQKYNFDAIVQEPLGDEFLLGGALQEPILPDKYLSPTPVDLELLTSGGLFKVANAPSTPGSQWISAVILRGDGMTMITQRLQVVKK